MCSLKCRLFDNTFMIPGTIHKGYGKPGDTTFSIPKTTAVGGSMTLNCVYEKHEDDAAKFADMALEVARF